MFLLTTNWSTNSFTSLPVWNFPAGPALATVFVNGIQSTSSRRQHQRAGSDRADIDGPQKVTDGFQFVFTNSVGALFGVLTTTNLALPLASWTALGGVAEIAPGQFQFTDPQATNSPRRFYRRFRRKLKRRNRHGLRLFLKPAKITGCDSCHLSPVTYFAPWSIQARIRPI